MLPQTSKEQAQATAERLRMAIANTPVILSDETVLHYTISVGISFLKGKQTQIDT